MSDDRKFWSVMIAGSLLYIAAFPDNIGTAGALAVTTLSIWQLIDSK